jgi:UDP-N-acetylmuramoyl-L-alanyl-D-glutamate--2,6-diaminopimelate ligase
LRLFDLMDGELNEVSNVAAIKEIEISGLTCDSRKVGPGFLFAAIPGGSLDGSAFIDDALEKGASAILAPVGVVQDRRAMVVTSNNPRRAYALMSSRFFSEQPSQIAAVTGTNGKTSVVSFARQLWTTLGSKAASMGTLGISAPDFNSPEGLTTPDPSDLHRNLSSLSKAGVEKLAMEASSHGLSQYRLDGVNVSIAAFTNLSRDHLDYHASMEEYLGAKLRLFREILPADGVAVLNADIDQYQTLCQAVECRVLSFGKNGTDIRLDKLEAFEGGQRLDLTVMGESYKISLPLSGAFQVENALCALGLILADGAIVDAAVTALETLEGVPGRLQHVGTRRNGAAVYVDYAHTPDALANVLKAMRPHARNRLNIVFGCGGDRDAGKRPEMGKIACDLADEVIVTDDNPRGENAAEIRAQVLAACPSAGEVGDRKKAIDQGVAALQAGDILIVAGKGHETGQIINGEVHPFDDADEIRRAIREAEA